MPASTSCAANSSAVHANCSRSRLIPNIHAEPDAGSQLEDVAGLAGGSYAETTANGDNLTVGLDLAVRTCGSDSDGDGLFDQWESEGIDHDGDGTIDQYGFVFPTVTHSGVETTATSFLFEADPDGHWVDADGNLNRDAAKAAWAVMKQLVDDGSVPLGIDNNGKRQFFVEGRASMMLEGPWIQGNINSAAPEIQAGLRVAPTPTSGQVYGGASNVLAVPAGLDPERAELAWKFIELFTSEEWQAKYATVAGQPPARAGVLNEEILAAIENMRLARLAGAILLPPMIAYYPQPRSVDDVTDFIVGKVLDVLGLEHALYRRWGEEA